jgi:hypothetical protein
MNDRIHWHYVATVAPELSAEITPYCKTRALAQLWVTRDWNRVSCLKCLRLRAKATPLKGLT